MENIDLTKYNGGEVLRISWDRGNGVISGDYRVDESNGKYRLIHRTAGTELDLTQIGVIKSLEQLC